MIAHRVFLSESRVSSSNLLSVLAVTTPYSLLLGHTLLLAVLIFLKSESITPHLYLTDSILTGPFEPHLV